MKTEKLGFYLALYGNVLVLLWLGFFKFTAVEAQAIEELIKNSPFTAWLYKVANLRTVSNIIGSIEIATALLLAAYPFSKKFSLAGGILNTLIYATTLSFLFTTPGTNRAIEGFYITDFFIIKDIVPLGIGLMVIGKSLLYIKNNSPKRY